MKELNHFEMSNSMNDFKVGDSAKCINNRPDLFSNGNASKASLTIGKSYKVLDIVGDILIVQNDNGGKAYLKKERFKKVKSASKLGIEAFSDFIPTHSRNRSYTMANLAERVNTFLKEKGLDAKAVSMATNAEDGKVNVIITYTYNDYESD